MLIAIAAVIFIAAGGVWLATSYVPDGPTSGLILGFFMPQPFWIGLALIGIGVLFLWSTKR